jgi:hypothetical protein
MANWLPKSRAQRDIDPGLFSSGWGLIGGLIYAVCLTYTVSKSHLIKLEEDLQSVFLPSVRLIRTKTDSRLENRFSSNPSAIEYLSQLDRDVIAMISARVPVHYMGGRESQDGSAVYPILSTPVYFVTPNFLNFTDGTYTPSGGQRAEALQPGSNSVVITRGLCQQVFGIRGTCPNMVYLKGRPFRVAGVYEFKSKRAAENKALFMPITSMRLVANPEKTFISKFALASPSAKALENLKESITRLQLSRDKNRARPAFELVDAPISFRTRFLVSDRFIPLKFVFWALALGFFLVTWVFVLWKQVKEPNLNFWRLSLGLTPHSIARDQISQFVSVHIYFQGLTTILVLILFGALKLRHPDFNTFSLDTFFLPLSKAWVSYFVLTLGVYFLVLVPVTVVYPQRINRP